MSNHKYIIITPAKNEEKYIEKTIQSVIRQTVLPIKWVIVDDGSSDRTTEIVKRYLPDFPFMSLVQREKSEKRNFASKVDAIKIGFKEVKNIDYNFYCNLDADVSFDSNYFEFLLKKFEEDPKLGICGGKVYDFINGKFIPQRYENHSVAGPVQFFRRECYECFGGYPTSKIGFIDGFAEISARMNGWITKTFTEKVVYHYRPVGEHRGNKLIRLFQGGKIEYYYGYYYPYHILRNLPRIFNKPFLIGYLAILLGYLAPLVKSEKRFIDENFKKYLKNEQKSRIKKYLESFKTYET